MNLCSIVRALAITAAPLIAAGATPASAATALYQEGVAATAICAQYSGNCTFLFKTVPAGETLTVTHASCYVPFQGSGTLELAMLGSYAGRTAQDSLMIARNPGTDVVYSINTMTNAYYSAGEQPRIWLWAIGAAYGAWSAWTLSGFYTS